MELSAREKIYEFINQNGRVSRNLLGRFVASNQDCVDELGNLIQEGYVIEKDGLYTISRKKFK